MTCFARRIMLAIAVLAIAGAVDSATSLQRHYAASKSSYCDLGGTFNCDIVNRSTYSTVSGIPVAGLGISGYLAILALATFYREKAETPALLIMVSVTGLVFSLYLTYVEAFILAIWCILCLCSLTLIFLIAVLSCVLLVHSVRHRKPDSLKINLQREADTHFH
jgi:vitamin-K-epoxide reductase (warfarin-sensitive)